VQVLAWMAVAISGLATGASPEVSYEASIRTELRFGTALGVLATVGTVGTEIAAIPSLTVLVTEGANLFSLQYDPQLLLPLYATEVGVLVLQRARGIASWGNPNAGRSFSLSEDFQYGTTDFFGLTRTSPNPPPPPQPVPTATSVLYVFSNTQGILGLRLSRTLQFQATAGFLVEGGADFVAQQSLPLLRGPYALMSLRKAVSVADDLETGVLFYGANFSTGSTNVVGEGTEGWIRRWNRYFKTDLAAGASGVLESPYRGAPYAPYAFPVARLTSTETRQTTRGRTLTVNVLVELAPFVDRLTGFVYQRFQALGNLDWSAPLGLGVLAQAGYGLPLYGNLTGADIVQLLGGELTYQPQPFLRFEAGIRGVWQQPLPGIQEPSSFQWVGLLGVLLKAGGPL
jgi:hypothetical protein